ncbi:MAG: CBASS cGAMP-activated phospholipase [Bryobacterales bacterium]|nr:CBASS cGAMP-activated phospholipase [Bryobacteraceae bacterium]MDW8355951.1 CBASS cGAMP-activated phospholipase [Bryobacterales bacterium]
MAPVKILSIDGGGIRGIIPAMVLAEIEERTGRPIARLFDLIAGTSTGGILALGLVKPGPAGRPEHSARKLAALYEKEGQRIFRATLWRRLATAGSLAEEKYSAEGLESVLREYFGEARLRDALTEVIITSYETERRMPFFFKSRHAKTREGYDFPMRLVARATSAAPTYFEPLKLEAASGDDYFSLIDGGVYANNPAMCGYVEARVTHPEADDFLLVSLGTGETTRRLRYEDVKSWGLASWAQPILQVVFDGVSSTVDYQLRQLLGPRNGERRYFRFQTRLDPGCDDMDDASADNVRTLRLLGEKLVRDQQDDLDELCPLLLKAAG